MKKFVAVLLLYSQCWAAVAFVNGTSGTNDAAGTSIAATAANHTTGNALVVHIAGFDNTDTVSSVADTALNTYTQCPSARATSATVGFSDIWVAKNITGNASNVVTATITSSTFRRISVDQYSGVDTASPVEVGQSGTASAALSVTSGSFSPAAANNVNVAGVATTNGETFTAGTNYALRTSPATDDQSEDRIGAPSGAQTASMSGNTSADWLISVCSLKQAGAGGATCNNRIALLGAGCS